MLSRSHQVSIRTTHGFIVGWDKLLENLIASRATPEQSCASKFLVASGVKFGSAMNDAGGGDFCMADQIPKPGRLLDTSIANFLVALCLPMFVALGIAKGIVYGAGSSWLSVRFALKVSLVAFQDFLFVLGWAVAGVLLLGWTRPRTMLRRALQWAYLLSSVFCVVYGIVNIWIYSALRMPLTYPLLMMAGDIADVRSSIAGYVTFSSVIAIIVAPLVYLIFVYSFLRTQELRRWKTYAILPWWLRFTVLRECTATRAGFLAARTRDWREVRTGQSCAPMLITGAALHRMRHAIKDPPPIATTFRLPVIGLCPTTPKTHRQSRT